MTEPYNGQCIHNIPIGQPCKECEKNSAGDIPAEPKKNLTPWARFESEKDG